MLWPHDDELMRTYQKVARDIGMVLRTRPEKCRVIVMSDHGRAISIAARVNLIKLAWRDGILARGTKRLQV